MDDPHNPYALEPVSLPDVRKAVLRVCGNDAESTWRELLAHAGVHGDACDEAGLERLLIALQGSAPALRLAARAVRIRQRTSEELAFRYAPREQPV